MNFHLNFKTVSVKFFLFFYYAQYNLKHNEFWFLDFFLVTTALQLRILTSKILTYRYRWIYRQTDRRTDTYHDQAFSPPGEPLSNVGGLFVESLSPFLLVIVVKSECGQPLTYGPSNTGHSTSSTS